MDYLEGAVSGIMKQGLIGNVSGANQVGYTSSR
jgi:hypothetical protein